jgi:uncharacterized protein (UPF0261 family)
MPTVVLLGTLDTKGEEYAFVRERLRDSGLAVIVVDAGVLGSPAFPPDVTRQEVAAAAGVDVDELASAADRGAAVAAMANGAATVVDQLYQSGRLDAALALGGTGGTSIAAQAFRGLPLGVPKVVVSTAASGETGSYVGITDLVLMPSVVDVAGLNDISRRILGNAAAAVEGMVRAPQPVVVDSRPCIGASMFGVTTPCVTAARGRLEELGYQVLVFHMTGVGGRTLEALAESRLLAGICDVTTTELADELVGGVFSAGPGRLTGGGSAGIPRVVSVGALDMVNFGPRETVPDRFVGRLLYQHNPTTTLMRTTPEECAELGARLAARVRDSLGPATVFLPLQGISQISTVGGPFYDPAADRALFDAVRQGLASGPVDLVELDMDVNDPRFAAAMTVRLHEMIGAAG